MAVTRSEYGQPKSFSNLQGESVALVQVAELSSNIMGVLRKKIKSQPLFGIFHRTMASKSFLCCVCNIVVTSTHLHRVTESYRAALSAIVGQPVGLRAKVCCAHFSPHESPRFTKANPARLLPDFNTPHFVSPSKRKSRAVHEEVTR